MARVEIATQGWGVIVDGAFNPMASQAVTLTNLDDTAATVYAARTGGTTTSLVSDGYGVLPGFVEPGTYKLQEPAGPTRYVEAVAADDVMLRSRGATNVRNYGALGDGTTNDTAAFTAAFAVVASAGGGDIYVPAGTYPLDPDTLAVPADTRLVGAGRNNTTLLRRSNGRLLDISGTSEAFGDMKLHVSIHDITFDGNGYTGPLVRIYYSQFVDFYHCGWWDAAGPALDAIQWWDSVLDWPLIQWCGSVSNSEPAVRIRKEATASGFGASSDNCNLIKFRNAEFHENAYQTVVLDSRTFEGTLTSQKVTEVSFEGRTMFEQSQARMSGPFIYAYGVNALKLDALVANLQSNSYDGTPINLIHLEECARPLVGTIHGRGGMASTTLSAGINDSQTTGISVTNYARLGVGGGKLLVGSEWIGYTSAPGDGRTLAGVTRGATDPFTGGATTPAAHSNGATAKHSPSLESVLRLVGTGTHMSCGRVLCYFDSGNHPQGSILHFASDAVLTNVEGWADYMDVAGSLLESSGAQRYGGTSIPSWRTSRDRRRTANLIRAWSPDAVIELGATRTLTAGTIWNCRRWFDTPKRVTGVAIHLRAASTPDDPVEAAIYDETFSHRRAWTGALTGKLNNIPSATATMPAGFVTLPFTSALWLPEQTVFQIALCAPTGTASTAAVDQLATNPPEMLDMDGLSSAGYSRDFNVGGSVATLPDPSGSPGVSLGLPGSSGVPAVWLIEA